MTHQPKQLVTFIAIASALGCAKVSWRGAQVLARSESVKGRVLGDYVLSDCRDGRGQPLGERRTRITVRERGGRPVLVESQFGQASLMITQSEVVGRARLFQALTFDERHQVLSEYYVPDERTQVGFFRLTPNFATRTGPLGSFSVPTGPAAASCRLEPVR